LDAAAREYSEALRLLPAATDAHRGLGAIATRRGRTAEARSHYEAILRTDPSDYRALRALGLLAYAQGDLDQAIGRLSAALKAANDDPPSLYHLGLALARKGNFDGAGFAFDRLEHAAPGKPYAPYGRAVMRTLQGQHEAALGALEQALDRGVDDLTKVEQDDVRAPLRTDPRWAALIAQARRAR